MYLVSDRLAPRCEHVGICPSELTTHGFCCERARQWLLSTHHSLSFTRSEGLDAAAPGWLRRKFQWGPTQWPVSWCEAARQTHIDCGVFAAFALEIFKEQGTAYPAQIMLAQPRSYTDQWRSKWEGVSTRIPWIADHRVYHEVCAVARPDGNGVRVYDPTEGLWLEPSFTTGINGVVGICVHSPTLVNWGTHKVGQGRWVMR